MDSDIHTLVPLIIYGNNHMNEIRTYVYIHPVSTGVTQETAVIKKMTPQHLRFIPHIWMGQAKSVFDYKQILIP